MRVNFKDKNFHSKDTCGYRQNHIVINADKLAEVIGTPHSKIGNTLRWCFEFNEGQLRGELYVWSCKDEFYKGADIAVNGKTLFAVYSTNSQLFFELISQLQEVGVKDLSVPDSFLSL